MMKVAHERSYESTDEAAEAIWWEINEKGD